MRAASHGGGEEGPEGPEAAEGAEGGAATGKTTRVRAWLDVVSKTDLEMHLEPLAVMTKADYDDIIDAPPYDGSVSSILGNGRGTDGADGVEGTESTDLTDLTDLTDGTDTTTELGTDRTPSLAMPEGALRVSVHTGEGVAALEAAVVGMLDATTPTTHRDHDQHSHSHAQRQRQQRGGAKGGNP
jgi:hypothetical protein